MGKIRVRVAFAPSETTASLLVRLSEEISSRGQIRFKLDSEKHLPHCTIGKLEVPPTELDQLQKELVRVVGRRSLPSISLSRLNAKKGYVGLDLDPAPELMEIYSDVLGAFENMDVDVMMDPHVTIARFEHEIRALEVARSFPEELVLRFFTARAVGIYQRGEENGTCSRLIAEIPLMHRDSRRRRFASFS